MSWNTHNKKSQTTSKMPEWLRLVIKVTFRLGLLGLICFALFASFYYYKASQFDLDKVAEQQLQNSLLDCHGTPLVDPNSEQITLITKDDLPQHLIDALIAREDASFETHCGIDVKGLARATVRNLKDMSFTQGASTITMQLARNTYDDMKAKSLHRKFLEIALTLRIESRYSKHEIMAYYLNRIYFGSGCYGIEQAAQKYFHKSTSQLNLSEAATIVGIIRGPHIFSPLRNLEAAEDQRNQVLNRMLSIGKITEKTMRDTRNTPLTLPKHSAKQQKQIAQTNGYAMNALERHLNEILADNEILAGGLTITTSFDSDLLQRCDKDIQRILSSRSDKDLQAACVVINHRTGAILSIIGGADIKESEFDRALDGKMDLGDAFTPFIYAIALERGKLPIKGNPSHTGRQLSAKDTVRLAKRFGFEDNFNHDDIFYGSGVSSPLKLATAFSVLTNEGKRPHTYFIQSIAQHDGTVLFKNTPDSKQAILEGSATETCKLLTTNKKTIQHTCYAFGGRALWSLASHGDRTAVLWLGYDKTRPVRSKKQLLQQMQQATFRWVN